MRNEKGQFQKGMTGNPAGRPKRADEQFLLDLWDEHGKKQFSCAIKNNERWALKVLLDKLYFNKKPDAYSDGSTPLTIMFDRSLDTNSA
jgi:hypothetical protein